MDKRRGGEGRIQISFAVFLLLSLILTYRVVQCEEENDGKPDFDNEVPILKVNTSKDKSKTVTIEPAKQHSEDPKDEQKKDHNEANADISDNQIVPQIQTNKSEPTKPH